MSNPQSGNFGVLDVSLSNAQLKALHSAPVTLLAAPGAGFFINVHRLIWLQKNSGASFNGGSAQIQLGLAIQTINVFLNSSDQVESDACTFGFQRSGGADNQALIVTAGSDSTTGDATVRVRAYYTVEPTT